MSKPFLEELFDIGGTTNGICYDGSKKITTVNGGPGSGNFDHGGRSGEAGGSSTDSPEAIYEATTQIISRWEKIKGTAMSVIHKVSELVGTNYDLVLDDTYEHARNNLGKGFIASTGSPVSYVVAAKISSALLVKMFSKLKPKSKDTTENLNPHQEAVKLMLPVVYKLLGV